MEMKLIALYYSIRHDLTGSTQKVIENLISTERNSVLEKSQTTAEIEKERASSEGDTNTIKAITDLLHGTDKGWFWQSRK